MNKLKFAYPTVPGEPATPRSSFFDEDILRTDTVYKGDKVDVRILEYTKPKKDMAKVRNELKLGGLVLGHKVENPDPNLVSFVIRGSARPILHESVSSGEGLYDYGDTALFLNLGNILGKLAMGGPQDPVVLGDKIAMNVSILEFTRSNEEKLQLVPGFELGLKAVKSDDAAAAYYSTKLAEEFGSDRFGTYEASFIDGFRNGITSIE